MLQRPPAERGRGRDADEDGGAGWGGEARWRAKVDVDDEELVRDLGKDVGAVAARVRFEEEEMEVGRM
jgi:hypothetical protein